MQNPEKDPEDWTTGDEPMTGPQRSYLQTLCREAKEDFDESLTKAEASKKIEELQDKTGAGKTASARRFFLRAGQSNFVDGRVSAFRNFRIKASASRFSSRGIRDGAIGRNDQVVIAHVGVVRGEEDAKIAGDAGQDQLASSRDNAAAFRGSWKRSRNASA